MITNRKVFEYIRKQIYFLIILWYEIDFCISDTKLPADVNKLGIFANDELNLEDVDVYGYDYDYTLAAYKKTMVEKMIYNLAKKALVQEFQYPDGILHRTYDPQSTIRGLHYDIHKGLLIKLNSMLQIQPDAVYRGKKRLSEYEVAELYPTRRLTLEDIEVGNYMNVYFLKLLYKRFTILFCIFTGSSYSICAIGR